MSDRTEYDFTELVLLLIQGDIDREQIAVLESLLRSEPDAATHYLELLEMYIELSSQVSAEMDTINGGASQYDTFLQALAHEEKVAPAVEICPPEEYTHVDLRTDIPRWKFNKSSLISVLVSIAAMFFFAVMVRFLPVNNGKEVATFVDCVDAKWADSNPPLRQGMRLTDRSVSHVLASGFAEILFDNHASVIIEGPAEFQLLSREQLDLFYGKIYAIVPPEAIGFIVNSEAGKVIDLGTEFGVDMNTNGTMELHVLKGKTILAAGGESDKTTQEVRAGFAKRIYGRTHAISSIPCDEKLFVNDIDSKDGYVWRGRKQLDMASMVTGGDGYHPNPVLGKLDLLTGRRTGFLHTGKPDKPVGYQVVASFPFIDGVFIPNRGDGQIVTSTGLRFEQCPETLGEAFYNISTIRKIPVEGFEDYTLALSDDSDLSAGIMLLHANSGITYDLSAIRRYYHGFKVVAFETDYGFPTALYDKLKNADAEALIQSPDTGTVEFYILVDGQVRRKVPTMSIRKHSTPGTVHIPLSPQDRFLSLISTDSNRNNNFDWLVLENATLILEE